MFTYLVLILLSSYSFSAIYDDIRKIPPANSVNEAKVTYKQRQDFFIRHYAIQELNKFPFYKDHDKALLSLTAAQARMFLDQDIEAVNDYLLDERFQPGPVGTMINLLGICKRKGDYDFVLQELIRLAYMDKGRLSMAARKRLRGELLNIRGNEHYSRFSLGVCGRHTDTENHILMTEVARYLTNQLLQETDSSPEYDNELNGFNQWMREHLRQFYQHGFSEINSKPYSGYTITALLNLYDFAEDREVRLGALALLDYLSMKFALESQGLVRYPTFRRQSKHYNHEYLHHKDVLTAMFFGWSGKYHFVFETDFEMTGLIPYGSRFATVALMSSYFPNDIVLGHLFSPSKSLNFYSLEHGAKQVTYLTEDYVISSGGVHRNFFPYFGHTNDVMAPPTVIIPAQRGDRLSELIYFLGKNRASKRSNLCVHENFLCGTNLHLPKDISPACVREAGNWTFLDFSKKDCNSPYRNVYAAVYRKNVRGLKRKFVARNFGFIEIRKADIPFEEFIDKVLGLNDKSYQRRELSSYTTSGGRLIKFQITSSKGVYEVRSVDGQPTLPADRWPRARGPYHQMDGNQMVISGPEGRVEYDWDQDSIEVKVVPAS